MLADLPHHMSTSACPPSVTSPMSPLTLPPSPLAPTARGLSPLSLLCVQGTPVRIVSVASSAHQMDGLDLDDLHFKKRKYSPWKAYGQSKLCNVLYAKELAHRCPVGTVAETLLSCLAAVLLCCFTALQCYAVALLSYCIAAVLPCSAIILHCCCIVSFVPLLWRCHALLSDCTAAMMLDCHAILQSMKAYNKVRPCLKR